MKLIVYSLIKKGKHLSTEILILPQRHEDTSSPRMARIFANIISTSAGLIHANPPASVTVATWWAETWESAFIFDDNRLILVCELNKEIKRGFWNCHKGTKTRRKFCDFAFRNPCHGLQIRAMEGSDFATKAWRHL